MPGKPGPKPKSKVVKLIVSSEKLDKWPSNSTPRPAPSPTPVKESAKDATPGADLKKEGTPLVSTPSGLEVPRERKKPGPPKGTKRKIDALLPDGTPKPRGKPGPKKRKLDGDEATRPWTTPAGPAAHKLGPKANQGAINAGLRALDRSGKPCRKWQKKTLTLKSFTGQVWTVPCFAAPKKAVVAVDGENVESSGNITNSNGPDGVAASSDAGASALDGTPNEGSAVPPASSPAPTGTPIEAAA